MKMVGQGWSCEVLPTDGEGVGLATVVIVCVCVCRGGGMTCWVVGRWGLAERGQGTIMRELYTNTDVP